MLRFYRFLLLISAFLPSCLGPLLLAQNNGANGDAMGVYSDIGHPKRQEAEFDRNYVPGAPACLRWPMNAIITSAGKGTEQKAAKKAQQEFDKGCVAIRKKSPDEALKHLELAVKADPAYAEAWIVLGQTQKEAGRFTDAKQSCTQGRQADPNYLPAYL